MKISYSPIALAQLDDIFAYIAKDNPTAAANVVAEIEAVVDHLVDFPFAGRLTDEGGVRMLVLSRISVSDFLQGAAEREFAHSTRTTWSAESSLVSFRLAQCRGRIRGRGDLPDDDRPTRYQTIVADGLD